VIALLPPLITLAVLASSRTVGRLVQGIPAVWLVGAQSFRIVVEIVLWWLVAAGAVPAIMSFTGRNFDVLVGLTAPIVASRCFVSRAWPTRLARWWNVAGIVVLVNTVVHAQLAAPTRFQLFVTTPPNTFIGEMPYIWLPAFLVPLAWALHILSFRQLAGTRQGARR
jgi:hypothetical protein